jgi:hypothetical protein
LVSGDFVGGGEFIRAWYVTTTGDDVVLVTYVTQEAAGERLSAELAEVEKIVASIGGP